MPVLVNRKNILFEPDSSRVIARSLFTGKERAVNLVNRVMSLSPKQQQETLTEVLRDYSRRHRSISKVFEKHFEKERRRKLLLFFQNGHLLCFSSHFDTISKL
jgi:hypothetical protein